MPIVIMSIMITFLVLISWTYHSLGTMGTSQKALWIIAQLVIVFIATYITYGISKASIRYPNETIMKYVQNTLVLIFTGINGLFVMPLFSKGLALINQENLEINQLFKRIGLCSTILLVLLLLECGYMTSTQEGILRVILVNN